MPFNRIGVLKAVATWLSVVQWKEQNKKRLHYKPGEGIEDYQASLLEGDQYAEKRKPEKEDISKIRIPDRKPLKYWVPGLLIVPIPEAGPILGYIDISYLAVLSYIIGSVFYVLAGLYEWAAVNPSYSDDANDPGIYLNTIAAGLFVVNALICFIDWYYQRKQLTLMNMNIDDEILGSIQIGEINERVQLYYFLNNLFFMAAAMVFLIQGIWYEDKATDTTHCVPHL